MNQQKVKSKLHISLDCEATGLDIHHIARPFLVTIFDGSNSLFWEWDVDPLTRMPIIPESHKEEIQEYLDRADLIVGQNFKIDVQYLESVGIKYPEAYYAKTHDTLFQSHIIASAEPHDLTTLALKQLRVDIQPFEDAIEKATQEARRIARREFKDWLIAKHGLPGMPSVKKSGAKEKEDKVWKADMWLPRAIAKAKNYPKEHPWWTVASEYATTDTVVTLPIYEHQKEVLEDRGLLPIYEERRKLIPIIVGMEKNGVTYSQSRLAIVKKQFKEDAIESEQVCLSLSEGKLDKLPKSGTTKAMRTLLFDEWKLPVVKESKKTATPSLDKDTVDTYLNLLEPHTDSLTFIQNLARKRKRDTSVSYMEGYERYAVTHSKKYPDYRRLNPSLNATGQVTLRWSSKNPNEQNISKQIDEEYKEEGWNLRYLFGPEPDREWWSFDFSNLELTLPAYESEEEVMIELLEKPDAPPYFGSYHYLNASILYPKEFYDCLDKGIEFKKKYKDTLYQWVKNTGFAKQYGAQKKKIDLTAHKEGAYELLNSGLAKIAKLSQWCIDYANEHGYITTIPDKELGSYPIQCSMSDWGKVVPTQPLAYRIQSSGCWCLARAMVRIQDYLNQLNKKDNLKRFITLQIHDEVVLDLPKGKTSKANLPVALKVQEIMCRSGNDIGIPLRANYSYHPNNFKEEEEVTA